MYYEHHEIWSLIQTFPLLVIIFVRSFVVVAHLLQIDHVLLVLWQHLCAQQLHLAQLFEHTERIVLAIRIVDQHVAEINHGDINAIRNG